MGRTVPSLRIAAEIERTKWKQFRSYLDKKDRKMFDQMYDCVKLYNTASMMACRPVVIHCPHVNTSEAVEKLTPSQRSTQGAKLNHDLYRTVSTYRDILVFSLWWMILDDDCHSASLHHIKK